MRRQMWPTYRAVIQRLVAAQVKPNELAVITESLSRIVRVSGRGARRDDATQQRGGLMQRPLGVLEVSHDYSQAAGN